MVLVFFGGNLDLRKCKFLTDVLLKSDAILFSLVLYFCMKTNQDEIEDIKNILKIVLIQKMSGYDEGQKEADLRNELSTCLTSHWRYCMAGVLSGE